MRPPVNLNESISRPFRALFLRKLRILSHLTNPRGLAIHDRDFTGKSEFNGRVSHSVQAKMAFNRLYGIEHRSVTSCWHDDAELVLNKITWKHTRFDWTRSACWTIAKYCMSAVSMSSLRTCFCDVPKSLQIRENHLKSDHVENFSYFPGELRGVLQASTREKS